MYNYFMLIGKIESIEKAEDKAILTLKVSRPFRNSDGKFEADYIQVSLYSFLAETMHEKKIENKFVAIKGRISSKDNTIELITERLIFTEERHD